VSVIATPSGVRSTKSTSREVPSSPSGPSCTIVRRRSSSRSASPVRNGVAATSTEATRSGSQARTSADRPFARASLHSVATTAREAPSNAASASRPASASGAMPSRSAAATLPSTTLSVAPSTTSTASVATWNSRR
jgi:hypothetical protein